MKKKALCIVAHPDDEIIWMGGKILREKDWDWTVFCLTRASDSDREPKFRKVCGELGVKGIIRDLDDETSDPLSREEIVEEIEGNLDEGEWDYIFTHGENGEYGHLRHIELNDAVSFMVENEILKGDLWFFSYDLENERSELNDMQIAVAKNGDLEIELSDEELKEKKRLVRDVYGYPEDGFEVMCCGGKEGFRKG
jgi:LmbE family N-acetylglucosaminyl deacetylase